MVDISSLPSYTVDHSWLVDVVSQVHWPVCCQLQDQMVRNSQLGLARQCTSSVFTQVANILQVKTHGIFWWVANLSAAGSLIPKLIRKKEMLGVNDMKLYEVLIFWLLQYAKSPQDRVDSAWATVSNTCANTRYSFLQQSGIRHNFQLKLRANSGEVSAQWAFPGNWVS